MPHVVFVHGLANKPEAEYLHQLWRRKLAHDNGIDLATEGVTSAMVYWADVLYPSPDTDLAAYESAVGDALEGMAERESVGADSGLQGADRDRYLRLLRRLELENADLGPEALTSAERAAIVMERIPLPAWLRNRLMARFARDAHLYFFNKTFSPRTGNEYRVRDELRARVVNAIQSAPDKSQPVIVVSHSMGTIMAYDVLKHDPNCPAIDGLITIGSPLGLDEVQDFFTDYKSQDAFPSERLRGPWVNVFDTLDPVAGLDPWFANDYRRRGDKVVEDISESNWGTWRHSISKYLQGAQLRQRLAKLIGV